MQQNRTMRYQKDQLGLTTMLEEQRQRQEAKPEEGRNGKRDNRGREERKECEIVLMKQDKKYIQFPEQSDIDNRAKEIIGDRQNNLGQRPSGNNSGGVDGGVKKVEEEQQQHRHEQYAALVHFRNSAHVMKDVGEENFQIYLRDVLRFGIDQQDELGILKKELIDRK